MRSLLTQASTVGAKAPKSWLTAFLAPFINRLSRFAPSISMGMSGDANARSPANHFSRSKGGKTT